MVLDLGCGQGTLFPYIAEHIELLVGLDLFPHDWIKDAKANRKNLHNVELIKSDAFHLPFRKEIFDAITAADVFEHMEHISSALKEVDRTLKKEGRIIVSVPTENGFYKFLRIFYRSQPEYKSSKSSPISDYHFYNASQIYDFFTRVYQPVQKKMVPFKIPLWLIFEVKKGK